ncbi:thermonuclease family protein [Azotobacter salinestris]|uniref:thermonuclease family protein n=1 Tax=Azotobacter salinestris TaxID=69964 RepID=UPI0012668C85|nr:thermonuclease family protein [Azotobacter salinestris]
MRFKLFASSLLSGVTTFASAHPTFCTVVGIGDGANFSCLTDAKQPVNVTLAKMKTPNLQEPYGIISKQVLRDLVLGKRVMVEVQTTDQYGRLVGRVYVDNIDVSAKMVNMGAAWVYRLHNIDKSLLALEAQARTARRGLWALPESKRFPPCDWGSAAQVLRREKDDGSPVRAPGLLMSLGSRTFL